MNKKTIITLFPVVIVLFASLFSSKYPDTLETLTEIQGFEKQAKKVALIFDGYNVPFINNQFLSFFFAGIIGLVLFYVLYRTIKFFTK